MPANHIDTHCHLDFGRLDESRAGMLSRAAEAGVKRFVIAGVRPESWADQRALAERMPTVRWSAGLHPVEAAHGGPEALARCMADLPYAFEGPGAAVAVGETGLDSRFAPPDTLTQQQIAFEAQLSWAVARDLPVVLHLVGKGVHGPALALCTAQSKHIRGVVHSFSGSVEQAKAWIALGLHIGLTGGVVRSNARKLHRVAREIPGDRLLVETDAPDQSLPEGPRPNEPACLIAIASAIAALRGEPVECVLERSDAAAADLYAF
ncbi:MAG: TatD family hydrolase [Bradymonadia bacterium]